jgi:hypothetical protein
MPGFVIERTIPVAHLAWLAAAPLALAVPGGGNSAATITASFANSCRDHYVGGGVVKEGRLP